MQSPSHGLLLEMYLMSQCDICSLKDKLEKNLEHLTVLVEALMVQGALSTMCHCPSIFWKEYHGLRLFKWIETINLGSFRLWQSLNPYPTTFELAGEEA